MDTILFTFFAGVLLLTLRTLIGVLTNGKQLREDQSQVEAVRRIEAIVTRCSGKTEDFIATVHGLISRDAESSSRIFELRASHSQLEMSIQSLCAMVDRLDRNLTHYLERNSGARTDTDIITLTHQLHMLQELVMQLVQAVQPEEPVP